MVVQDEENSNTIEICRVHGQRSQYKEELSLSCADPSSDGTIDTPLLHSTGQQHLLWSNHAEPYSRLNTTKAGAPCQKAWQVVAQAGARTYGLRNGAVHAGVLLLRLRHQRGDVVLDVAPPERSTDGRSAAGQTKEVHAAIHFSMNGSCAGYRRKGT